MAQSREKTGAQGTSSDELVIGSTMFITGDFRELGINIIAAAQMAVDEINQAGGVKVGRRTYRIKHLITDDGYQPERAVANAISLIYGEKIKFLLTTGAGTGEAACRITDPEKAIHFSIASSDTFLKGREYTFRLYSVDIENTIGIFRYLKDKYPEKRSIYITSSDDESGHHHAGSVRKAADYHGYNVLAHYHWATNSMEKEFSPMADDIVAKNPHIVHTSSPPNGALLPRLAWEKGWRGLAITNTAGALDFLGNLGPAGEGALNPGMDFKSELLPEGIRGFAARYRARFKADPMQWSTYIHSTVYAIAEACKKAGTVEDTDRIRKVFETETLDTPWGKVKWGGKEVWGVNHHAFLPKPVGEFRNGKIGIAAVYSVEEVMEDFLKIYGG